MENFPFLETDTDTEKGQEKYYNKRTKMGSVPFFVHKVYY